MAKKITLLEINDYKKIRSVVIEPGEATLMLIGGDNTEGKSSLLGAMTAALGGGRELPEDPIRHGAKKASIRVVFDDGELVVRRRFTSKGSTLEVTNAEGKVSSPQKMLDQIIGKRFLDPMKFSRLSALEQRATLLPCVDMDIDLDASVAAEKVAYDDRRDVNRDIKKLEAKLEDCTIASVPELKDHAVILAVLEELQEAERESDGAGVKIGACENRIESLENDIRNALADFKAARTTLEEAKANRNEKVPAIRGDIEELESIPAPDLEAIATARDELDQCSMHNANVAKLQADKDQRVAMEAELIGLQGSADAHTEVIDGEKDARISALAAADMPIEGLSFGDDGLILDGAPFAQASGAERLRASIAISWALSPELCDVWVEDGALLDEKSLDLVRQFAVESGLRIWLERVGDADENAIIMVDGSVSE